jgi:hypothetical protein
MAKEPRARPPRRVSPRPPEPPPPAPEAAVGEVVPPTVGPPAPASKATWADWYNAASPEDQSAFDRAASVIDNGGAPYQKGGTYESYVDNWKSRGPAFYAAIVNYRDTGGRVAFFSVPPKDYGTRPISAAAKGGPIEPWATNMLVLHPGRYTYSDVMANGPAFRSWLGIVTQKQAGKVLRPVTVGQVQTSPSVLPGGDPYYVDYEFMVAEDTAWPDNIQGQKLMGTPTWLPPSINIVDYWGQVTKSKPDWLAPARALDKALDFGTTIGTIALAAGIGYVVLSLRPTRN